MVGSRYCGLLEKLAASCPVAVCQSESAVRSIALNRPTNPPVPVTNSTLLLVVSPAGFGVVPPTRIA